MMQLSTAYNIHNRGAFQTGAALASGGMSKDRQSGGETYMPFQQGDAVSFGPAQPSWSNAEERRLNLLTDYIFNIDTRVITSLIATLIFGAVFQALAHSAALTAVLGLIFFTLWYIMSYFNFQRALFNAQHGPRQMRYSHHQVPVTL